MGVDRRTLLAAIGVGVMAAITRTPAASAARAPVGVLTRLPGEGNQLALTVDDGASSAVVAAFGQFCRDTGTRLTFFVNGDNPSWSDNAASLRPMVDSGQIQVGNHTWSHPYLNRISLTAVGEQIQRNADFLRNTYGTDGTPYFRPPFGVHTADTDRVAADLGYPTITLWSGTIGDSRPENEASLVAAAARSFAPQQIILAHANLPTVTHCYDQLSQLITSRNLQTVTLNDAFG
jgi:peptidoglycan/xylan/chitin deacetylase (PgdA/CDA1 family)